MRHVCACRELGARGVKSMLAVPVSFVSEHIETLEEIDMEYRELAEESGIHNWGRVPALNTNEVRGGGEGKGTGTGGPRRRACPPLAGWAAPGRGVGSARGMVGRRFAHAPGAAQHVDDLVVRGGVIKFCLACVRCHVGLHLGPGGRRD